jgi:hypothetical protein
MYYSSLFFLFGLFDRAELILCGVCSASTFVPVRKPACVMAELNSSWRTFKKAISMERSSWMREDGRDGKGYGHERMA